MLVGCRLFVTQVSSINRVLRNLSSDTQKGGSLGGCAAGPAGHHAVYSGLFGSGASPWHRTATNPWYGAAGTAAVMHGAAAAAAAAGCIAATQQQHHRQLTQAGAAATASGANAAGNFHHGQQHSASTNIDRKCTPILCFVFLSFYPT